VSSSLVPSLINFLFGKPLASYEDRQEKIGAGAGIPIFGLDALSSAAYGPEAALTILLPLGLAGLHYITALSTAIVILLSIVYFSYRQTIAAYPQGGGSYTVAHENLGLHAGLLAAAALMIDYVLNVAVGISAGVGALVSAVPSLQPHTLELCLGILVFLTLINLRGLREAGVVFLLPTWLFVGTLGGTIVWGAIKTIGSGGHPMPVVPPHQLMHAAEGVSAWLLIKAFASGCTAMTGVEAVSNGTQAFRDDVVRNARLTLTAIIAILIALLLGIAWQAQVFHVGATPPGQTGYQSILSQLIGAVAGRGLFYYTAIASIVMVVSLSANTSFADFPRLCRAVANNRYLPWGFTLRGRRLVYSQGIYVLTALAAVLLIIFQGVTDRLIPLFAVGAFLAFTLSQAGMVAHWRKQKSSNPVSIAINGIGACATGATLLVVITAKFMAGAWITLLLIPALVLLMNGVGRHYQRVGREIAIDAPISLDKVPDPIVLVPIDSWSKISRNGIQFAMTLSPDVRALHIETGEVTNNLQAHWEEWVAEPARRQGRKPPELVVLQSPFRYVVTPIIDYVRRQKDLGGRRIEVVIPEMVEQHWYQYFLHNQRGRALSEMLKLEAGPDVVIINTPWYLGKSNPAAENTAD
jgi:amino acid transporter